MNAFIVIVLIAYTILFILNMIIDNIYQKKVQEIMELAWDLLDFELKIRTILLESELINEDKAVTLEKIKKVLANKNQPKANTSTIHI